MTNPKQTEPTDAMSVSQADRESAAEIFGAYESMAMRAKCLDGELDMHPTTEAFTRHRVAALTASQNAQKSERVEALEEALRNTLPKNVALDNTNIPDSHIVPLDVTMRGLRAIRALIDGEET